MIFLVDILGTLVLGLLAIPGIIEYIFTSLAGLGELGNTITGG